MALEKTRKTLERQRNNGGKEGKGIVRRFVQCIILIDTTGDLLSEKGLLRLSTRRLFTVH